MNYWNFIFPYLQTLQVPFLGEFWGKEVRNGREQKVDNRGRFSNIALGKGEESKGKGALLSILSVEWGVS